MSAVGVVVIGRNEGERLCRCLASVTNRGIPVVYVDSASTDGSSGVAHAAGATVVALDPAGALSAARARNEGVERLIQLVPEVRFVQFLDGDCELVPGWLEHATHELEGRPQTAVVCGNRRERFPHASIYNRVTDTEWDRPVGEATSCGGDAMIRVAPLRAVGGFNPSVTAGEEPELCQRLRAQGHTVVRLDADMSIHDAGLLRFPQWWARAVRSGYGALDVATRFGERGLFVRQVRSARLWAVGWPLAVILSLGFGSRIASSGVVAAVAALIVLLLPLQMLCVAFGTWRHARVRNWRTALSYGVLTLIGKWAQVVGQVHFLRDQTAGRQARLIEYKT